MPPTQSVNVVTSPIFYSSSLESGSQLLPPHDNHDGTSWASALSSKAHSARPSAEGGGWVNITLGPVDEGTWQEEAHWMSFHHAIQSLVLTSACQKLEHTSVTRSRANSHSSSSSRKIGPHQRTVQSLRQPDSPVGSQKSNDLTGDSCSAALAHYVTRQIMGEVNTVAMLSPPRPVETIELTTHHQTDTAEKTRLALAQAEQDEWEIMGKPTPP